MSAPQMLLLLRAAQCKGMERQQLGGAGLCFFRHRGVLANLAALHVAFVKIARARRCTVPDCTRWGVWEMGDSGIALSGYQRNFFLLAGLDVSFFFFFFLQQGQEGCFLICYSIRFLCFCYSKPLRSYTDKEILELPFLCLCFLGSNFKGRVYTSMITCMETNKDFSYTRNLEQNLCVRGQYNLPIFF